MKILKYFISIHMPKNTNIYTTCWIYIRTHGFKKYAKINTTWKKSFFLNVLSKHTSRPFHWLTTYFGKKRKENKYKFEKHHIYIYIHYTMTTIYIIIDSKKNTYKTILLEDCTIKQRKIKLKVKENQKNNLKDREKVFKLRKSLSKETMN